MDTRFAHICDGIDASEAARRTSFVITDDEGIAHLVRTQFTSATSVRVAGAPPGEEVLEELAAEIGWWSPQVTEIHWGDQTRQRPDALPLSVMRLGDLTVGQLTVEDAKVAAAKRWITTPEDVVLTCCWLDDETMIVDGHSRAVAAHELGLGHVLVTRIDASSLNRETRRWCRDAGIVTVGDLAQHVVEPDTHRHGWVSRCQAWLADHTQE